MRLGTAKHVQANVGRFWNRVESGIFLVKNTPRLARTRVKRTKSFLVDSTLTIVLVSLVFVILCLIEWLRWWA